ncbi:uncharacterized protein LOC123877551 [Maniola jurtina]|uniref:uncharacterized protein LOC123877551 n=1 Tax=Maniola jurtina TaxID=191418 RepID=UPI001E6860C6|nr:uncharacterized protein LOC123877551 [Maniola jurtina]XP_045780322.1 uncharacterized protein LOC123877551 [Maniola jurtina]
MDPNGSTKNMYKRKSWRFPNNIILVTLYIFLFIVTGECQNDKDQSSHIDSLTKSDINKLDNTLDSNKCHSCQISNSNHKSNKNEDQSSNMLADFIDTVSTFSEKYVFVNGTERKLQNLLEKVLDEANKKDRYEIIDGVELKTISKNETKRSKKSLEVKNEERALFSSYTYEYRLFQKIKNFIDTHIVSINLPKVVGLRSFGLKKFFLPLLIGAQIFKSILIAMFLPSLLGSFGKILGKGISQISAASSQASYPPANTDDQMAYNNDNGNFMGYETNPAATYAYSPDMYGNMEANDVNDAAGDDSSRFGPGGAKVSYLPTKNGYYKNQMSTSNNYKIFQKIPASSMILSNYDPFYSPLLSRLDGIFARLGLAPTETTTEDGMMIGGQTLSDVKLEACREQLICLMYSSPAKYAPYSNLVSAQLSRELNELRRPVSDNPEILRFFRYMRAARRGQEGTDCIKAHPACATNTAPSHTMIAAYHDINKLVTARKLFFT